MKSALMVFVSILGLAGCATSDEFREGDVVIESPWARSSAGRTATGVVYLRLSNLAAEPEQLLAVTTPIAAGASVHRTMREHGMMSMQPLQALALAANETVSLEPGGLHIMLMQLSSPLAEGETFPMTLSFERAGAIDIQVTVGGAGAMSAHE